MATIMTPSAERTARALWTLIEPQPQEVKDYLVHIITLPSSRPSAGKSVVGDYMSRLKAMRALKGCLKDVPAETFAGDEKAQYILNK